MGRPLPRELRDRVVGAWKGKGSTRELARLFDLGEATVDRWVARYNDAWGSREREVSGRLRAARGAGAAEAVRAPTREYGWAPSGQRLVDHVPRHRGTLLTMIGALTADGIEAMMTHIGGTSGEGFESFVRDHVVPVLEPGDVVVFDHLGAHHRESTEHRGDADRVA